MKPSTMICQVTDMSRAVAFYRDVLGLPPTLVTPGWSQFDLEGISLGLHPVYQGSSGPGPGGWSLGLECESLKALAEKLSAAGHEQSGPHDVPGGAVITFADPDGNPVQVIQRGITAAQLK
jgi:predicted enzyme related to lactoylglutathione lyase